MSLKVYSIEIINDFYFMRMTISIVFKSTTISGILMIDSQIIYCHKLMSIIEVFLKDLLQFHRNWQVSRS